MKQLYLTLLLIAVYASAIAQADFRRGYIIQNADTVRGYVDYRGASRSAQVATFKPTFTGEEIIFTPGEIAGYGFTAENKIFEAKELPAADTLPTAAEEKLFLNALIKGRASIYFYRDEHQRDRFFLSKNNGPLVELLITEYNKTDEETGKKYSVRNKLYKGVLSQAFSDCSGYNLKHIENISLTQNSLAKAAQAYNACVGGASYKQPTGKAEVKLGFALGFASTTLKFSGDHYLDGASFTEKSLNAGAGISMNLTTPAISEKLSLQLELLYDPSKFTGRVQKEQRLGRSYMYDVDIEINYLKLPAQFRYTYPRGKLQPFLNAGAVMGYAISHKQEATETSTFGSTTTTQTTPAFGDGSIRKYTVGAVAGAGLGYSVNANPITLEGRYEKTDGITRSTGLSSPMDTFYLILNYRF
ncbi:outer membrane beta-barrel protein [Pontibacter russatus]|uniref:outer membrane beta-barrel protein n=1 Tax=Pontibacter russatus TaxID=2694929 RepID=UPI00137B4604|nr:outer membrane beta-barrel protein [Pontibacter russatus]